MPLLIFWDQRWISAQVSTTDPWSNGRRPLNFRNIHWIWDQVL